MIGLEMPDIDRWSDRVVVALGQNPSLFTGPGTNTYLVGTGKRRILLDTGQGCDAYIPVLERALERAGCEGIQEIVLTHGHPDHIGGAAAVIERFGALRISKQPWEGVDVRGHALSCVIIDKLPFASPADPIIRGRIAQLKQQGKEPFYEYQIPTAAIALKQRAGGLIRDIKDTGILMICDPRLAGRSYSRYFFASLPPMKRTRNLQKVIDFAAQHCEIK